MDLDKNMNGSRLINFPLEVIEAAQRRYRDLYPTGSFGVTVPKYGEVLEEEYKKWQKSKHIGL